MSVDVLYFELLQFQHIGDCTRHKEVGKGVWKLMLAEKCMHYVVNKINPPVKGKM